MAERRTFSRRIIESGRMMKLPAKVQLLYVHLCMNADDDGVVEAFTVLPMLGAAEKELQCLEDKGFIRILNEDLVCFIVDWVENNPTRGDRIKPSVYRDLLMEKVPEARLQNVRERADKRKNGTPNGRQMDVQWTTNGRPMDAKWTSNGQQTDVQRTPDGRPRDVHGTSNGRTKEGPSSDSSLPENERKEPTLSSRVCVPKESTPEGQEHGSASWITPPTPKEVRDYFAASGLRGDPQAFFDTRASVGWIDALGRKITDWRASARKWASQENLKAPPIGRASPQREKPRDYDGSYDAEQMTEVTI